MSNQKKEFKTGYYGFDVEFFKDQKIATVELRDSISNACVLIVPGYQGRVITSTANGKEDISFGWINYDYIKSGKKSAQFNPYGGEERLWFGPEGGPFSIYFEKGKEQSMSNWFVPKEIDTEPFDIIKQESQRVTFHKKISFTNYIGNTLKIDIGRKIKLLTHTEVDDIFGLSIDSSLKYVAFETENTLVNDGDKEWNEQTGMLSLWILCMINASADELVFVPFKKGSEKDLGIIVSDEYFGKVPSERLIVKDGVMFFKTDGKVRSKIGISHQRALPYIGSYDIEKQVLTIVWFSLPEEPLEYLNSQWGKQDNPLKGDVINAYNDGPNELGNSLGSFYEMESSSPAAKLKPGDKITHTQRMFHIVGAEDKLSQITEKLFNLPLSEIKNVFEK